MVKKFTIPFASQGDANDIPDALQVDGKVSFTQGFGYDYERPYDDPQAKDIAREDMNGLFKAITSAVGELQTLGASEWSNAVSYPKGAIVYFEKDLYISQVDDNQSKPPQNWVSITSIANDSLKKAANLSDLTDKATARNNLGLGSSATLNKTDVPGTSTNLVATQKLVNDTKINLESSKQDKLEFVGSGRVMREGAYGLGGGNILITEQDYEEMTSDRSKSKVGFYAFQEDAPDGMRATYGIFVRHQAQANYSAFLGFHHLRGLKYIHKTDGVASTATVYDTLNTSTDSSGFLRASGNKETFTKDLVSQSTGSSTASVMSQKAVTDRLNAIESGHGLGYGQQWVDITGQRVAGATYTNNTGKPIMVAIGTTTSHFNYISTFKINSYNFEVAAAGSSLGVGYLTTIIIPVGSTYSLTGKFDRWLELR